MRRETRKQETGREQWKKEKKENHTERNNETSYRRRFRKVKTGVGRGSKIGKEKKQKYTRKVTSDHRKRGKVEYDTVNSKITRGYLHRYGRAEGGGGGREVREEGGGRGKMQRG